MSGGMTEPSSTITWSFKIHLFESTQLFPIIHPLPITALSTTEFDPIREYFPMVRGINFNPSPRRYGGFNILPSLIMQYR